MIKKIPIHICSNAEGLHLVRASLFFCILEPAQIQECGCCGLFIRVSSLDLGDLGSSVGWVCKKDREMLQGSWMKRLSGDDICMYLKLHN